MVVRGEASDNLLDSYHDERKHAANENIMHSSRTADFLTPRSEAHKLFRNAVLDLVRDFPFARPMVNSGRLSRPATYDGSMLNGGDDNALPRQTRPGSAMVDASTGKGWLLNLFGDRFAVLVINTSGEDLSGLPLEVVGLECEAGSSLAERYLGSVAQAIYLIRPDQHVAARWQTASPKEIMEALSIAMGGKYV
jgi:3-(3-hydroxy-phenyl)propionate hydroxylase